MRCKVLVALAMLATCAFGQGERGTLNGTVNDPSGAVMAAATVKALNVATGVETTVTTTNAGVYRLPYLPPGTYKLSVSAPGFKMAVRDNIVLSVAQTLTVDFALEVGAVTDQVTVSSDPPLLETGTAEIGSYVSKKEFDTWPITVGDGRRQIQQFIFTSLPGTVGGTFQGSINGGQNYSHEILIDGIALGRMDLQGGSNNEFSPSAETISEMKLQTGMVGAQYGGGQTAVANFATKSGTNELHGSGYWYVQNDVLRANGWGNNAGRIKRQPFKQHNYGYALGGPVLFPKLYDGRNKTFFYHNIERTRVRDYSSTTFGTLPIPAYKQGDFSRLFNPAFTGVAQSGTNAGTDAAGRPVVYGAIYDPNTSRQVGNAWVRDVFPGNVVPRNRFSPVVNKIFELAPITDPVFDTMINNIPTLGTCCPHFEETMLSIKGDHNFSSSQRISATFTRNFRERNNSPGGRYGTPPGSPTGVYQLQATPGTLGRFAHDWTLTPTILNHFAMGYNRFGNNNESAFVDQDWPQKIGLENVPGTHFPRITFAGLNQQGGGIAGGGLGSASRGGSYNGSTIIADDMTIIRGSHNFKLGFEQRRYYYNSRGKSGSGDWSFSPISTGQIGFNAQTGHSFASFLLGASTGASRAVTVANPGHRWRETAFYFSDDWKVNQKLTLNLGLRWEIIGGLFEVAGRMSGLGLDAVNPGAGNRLGALVFVDDLGRKGFMDRYWKQFSPKFGFAYAISNKLVMRGGYGINNTPTISNGFGFGGTLGYNGNIPVNSNTRPIQFAEQPVIFLHERFPDFTAVLPNKNPSQANAQGITYTAPDSSRLPYVQNWTLGFQYQLPAATVLELNYVGNKGTRLLAPGYDSLNQVPLSELARGNSLGDQWNAASGIAQPFPGFTGTVVQALRPYPQFTGISQQFPNLGTSTYNSLQLQLTRHFRSGLSLLVAHTFSKTINTSTDSSGSIDGSDTIADVFNRRLEKSIANFHYPHFFKITWIYELPIGPGKSMNVGGVAGKVIGGWSFTGNHFARSGTALGIGTNVATNPLTTARPDQVLGQEIISNANAGVSFNGFVGGETYLNRNAFTDPPVHPGGRNIVTRLGTLGRILPNIRGPMSQGHDLGVVKAVKFTETVSWEIRGVFQNFMNQTLRGNPVTSLNSPFFGQITGKGGRRNIELSTRITF